MMRAQKDHLHFTDKCCQCFETFEDIVPVWIERSGHYEPDYVCKTCYELSKKKLFEDQEKESMILSLVKDFQTMTPNWTRADVIELRSRLYGFSIDQLKLLSNKK